MMALTPVYINLCFGWFLLTLSGSSPLSISEFEVPKSEEVGNNVLLKCRHTLEDGETEQRVIVKWWLHPLLDEDGVEGALTQRSLIYQRIGGLPPSIKHAHHNNISIKGDDTLELLSVTSEDSGMYECEVSNMIDEQRRHQLLVVYTQGSGPVLNWTSTKDEDVITCVADDVSPRPELSITVTAPAGITLNVTQGVSDPVEGMYDIEASAVIPSGLLENEATIVCELFFKDQRIPHPVYQQTLSYSTSSAEVTDQLAEEEPTLGYDEAAPDPRPDGANGYTHNYLHIFITIICILLMYY